MATPRPDLPEFDAEAFADYLDQKIADTETPKNERWRVVLVPEKHKTIAAGPPVRGIDIVVSNAFAHELSQIARTRFGISRSAFVRLVLVDAVHRLTGRDRDDILGDMPPRKSHAHKYRQPPPSV